MHRHEDAKNCAGSRQYSGPCRLRKRRRTLISPRESELGTRVAGGDRQAVRGCFFRQRQRETGSFVGRTDDAYDRGLRWGQWGRRALVAGQ